MSKKQPQSVKQPTKPSPKEQDEDVGEEQPVIESVGEDAILDFIKTNKSQINRASTLDFVRIYVDNWTGRIYGEEPEYHLYFSGYVEYSSYRHYEKTWRGCQGWISDNIELGKQYNWYIEYHVDPPTLTLVVKDPISVTVAWWNLPEGLKDDIIKFSGTIKFYKKI